MEYICHILYIRNEKEKGITCGVNTVLSVLVAILITQMERENAVYFSNYFLLKRIS